MGVLWFKILRDFWHHKVSNAADRIDHKHRGGCHWHDPGYAQPDYPRHGGYLE